MSDRRNRVCGRVKLADAGNPFLLECGQALTELRIAYETYGHLNADGSNAVLVCHALTGSAHAAGTDDNGNRGWWDGAIGPGLGIDTDRWFVICSNVLGGRYGSTGPGDINPATGVPYGAAFPPVTVRDMVRAQRLLLNALGIDRLAAVAGGSMGGMQVLEWGLLFPQDVGLLIPIACGARHLPWRIGMSAAARAAIELGRRAGDEMAGLHLARMIAISAYRSQEEFNERFGRERASGGNEETPARFLVETYLERHGEKLVERFDAATYELLLGAMDGFDVTDGRGDLYKTLGALGHPTLCIGISSDLLYPASEVRELAGAIPNGQYRRIESRCGHDAFLIEYDQLNLHLSDFLDWYGGKEGPAPLYAAVAARYGITGRPGVPGNA